MGGQGGEGRGSERQVGWMPSASGVAGVDREMRRRRGGGEGEEMPSGVASVDWEARRKMEYHGVH